MISSRSFKSIFTDIQLNYKVFQSTDSKHSSLTLLAKNTLRTYEEHMKKHTSLLHLVE